MSLAWRGFGANGAFAWLGYGDDLEALFGVVREVINLLTRFTKTQAFNTSFTSSFNVISNINQAFSLTSKLNRLEMILSTLALTKNMTSKINRQVFILNELKILSVQLEQVEDEISFNTSLATSVEIQSKIMRAKELITNISRDITALTDIE